MIGSAPAAASQRVDRIDARREPRRGRTEDDAGDERETERERQYHWRRTRVDWEERRAGECERQQQPGSADRDEEPGGGARNSEQNALDERRRNDLPARGAHRKPHGRLTAPGRAAGEQ
jgi:hypothetical protein